MVSIEECKICGEFPKALGIGPKPSLLMIIGQSPSPIGSAITGIPFTSPLSGTLLNRCLETAGIKREDVYITNIVKCGVPNPEQSLQKCIKWFKEELRQVSPAIIVALGSLAQRGINLCRDELHPAQRIYSFPHPSYAVRRGLEDEYIKMWERLKVK